jgi:hypothetical protein
VRIDRSLERTGIVRYAIFDQSEKPVRIDRSLEKTGIVRYAIFDQSEEPVRIDRSLERTGIVRYAIFDQSEEPVRIDRSLERTGIVRSAIFDQSEEPRTKFWTELIFQLLSKITQVFFRFVKGEDSSKRLVLINLAETTCAYQPGRKDLHLSSWPKSYSYQAGRNFSFLSSWNTRLQTSAWKAECPLTLIPALTTGGDKYENFLGPKTLA